VQVAQNGAPALIGFARPERHIRGQVLDRLELFVHEPGLAYSEFASTMVRCAPAI
jgi:hypothetical protein